jgi:hypothetical protein
MPEGAVGNQTRLGLSWLLGVRKTVCSDVLVVEQAIDFGQPNQVKFTFLLAAPNCSLDYTVR